MHAKNTSDVHTPGNYSDKVRRTISITLVRDDRELYMPYTYQKGDDNQ